MTYLLDTNPCVRYLNGSSEVLRHRIDEAEPGFMAVCSIVKAELFYGAMKSQNPGRVLEMQQRFLSGYASMPFDDAAARQYGVIRAELEKAGSPIGANDLLIAAIAVANNLVLVTHNTREFSRVSRLELEDWEAE